jgi:HlyD family secretion protein
MITRVSPQPGEVLVLDTAAVTLTGNVAFKAFIDQTQVNSVQPGDHATVRLLAHPGKQFKGTVIRVNPSIDTRGVVAERGRIDTRFTYSAWVELEGEEVPPGLQGHVEFRKEITRPSVPESAVIHLSGGEGMVMVVRDGRAAMARVELGPARGAMREVKHGLAPGDEVVLHPLGLKADDLVEPAEQVASSR